MSPLVGASWTLVGGERSGGCSEDGDYESLGSDLQFEDWDADVCSRGDAQSALPAAPRFFLHDIAPHLEAMQPAAADAASATFADAVEDHLDSSGNLESPSAAPPKTAVADAAVRLPAAAFAFGGSASSAAPAVAPPPPPEDSPVAAAGLEDYRRRLAAFPEAALVERRLRLCVGDVDSAQDERDLSLEEVVVNGVPVGRSDGGASPGGGYRAAVAALAGGLRAAAAPGDSWTSIEKDRVARVLLGALGRTTSGRATFEEALRQFGHPEAVLLAPDRAAAGPLEIVVLRNVVVGRAHARYNVLPVDKRDRGGKASKQIAVVDAVFVFSVSCAALRRIAACSAEDRAPNEWRSAREPATWPAEEVSAAVVLFSTT
eukprot:TRINITY_DN65196_c0_g1_i1.p1 TRINITY_DN65196_c0_g1~~TRINITY_DN65196_c0_g1_i1.p1  ORF type:complete len:398 (+),score=90.64 TRINITY_DN65196_c0_g1_i1:74-1195(+)